MQKELDELLEKAKILLKDEVTTISYDTWIKPLEIDSMEQNNIVLKVVDVVAKDTLLSRYHNLLVNTFNFITNKTCTVSLITKDESIKNTNNFTSKSLEQTNAGLKSEYSFDTYVVGNNNRFAHAASLAVAEAPGTSYNPLYLYGGVGLGKTHLMHAIGNEVLKNNKDLKVLYVTSEKFTNEFINAIKDNKNEEFRNKYRNIDVLMIDDIQFIAAKERIQEEFFHTFNTLHENKKQIVLSSDKAPKDIDKLEDRLKSRFEWGLLADISKADYETRLAILRKKVQIENLLIDDEILSNIATKIDTNIRELEGTLNKILATASLTHSPITIEMSERAINDIISQKEKVISSDYIQEIVSKYFNINIKDLKSSKRSNDIAYPRQIAMYLCRDIANMPFTKIGEAFGKRDHTTVMHACTKIEKEIKENSNTNLIVESVKNLILTSKH